MKSQVNYMKLNEAYGIGEKLINEMTAERYYNSINKGIPYPNLNRMLINVEGKSGKIPCCGYDIDLLSANIDPNIKKFFEEVRSLASNDEINLFTRAEEDFLNKIKENKNSIVKTANDTKQAANKRSESAVRRLEAAKKAAINFKPRSYG